MLPPTVGRVWIVVLLAVACGVATVAVAGGRGPAYCSKTAKLARTACRFDVRDDLALGMARCLNFDDQQARNECKAEAKEEKKDAKEECAEVYEARRDVCDLVGEARYDPAFDPANFVDPADIGGTVEPNPYLPLIPGAYWILEGGGEVVTDTVLDKTKVVDGVTCRVVLDVVEEDGVMIERTDDWYAQDLDGNVWYCGESARDFETFPGDEPEDPELVEIDGSFKAGRDGAKPGIVVLRAPQVGDAYRQEVSLGDAEDVAEVTSITGTESTPAASCDGTCLVTRDLTPLEPGVEEMKYYAPGVGLILEVGMDGSRTELVEYSIP